MSDKDWSCKIDEGSAGLVHVTWSPDGRHILNTAQFHVSHPELASIAMVGLDNCL